MLNPNINERISWNNYFQHPFFNNNQLNLPIFNYKCNIHSKDYNTYCVKCKKNICEICLKEHSSHNIIPFNKIGLSQNEIKQFNDIIKEIDNNMKNIENIKNEIIKFINDIKLINDNNSIYENDNNNNYKYYSIECLKIINDKLKIEKNIFPKIEQPKIEKPKIEQPKIKKIKKI